MRTLTIAAALALAATPAFSQHAGHGAPARHETAPPAPQGQSADPHAGHRMPSAKPDPHAGHGIGSASPAATQGPAHAADTVFDPSIMRGAREQLRAEQGDMQTYRVLVDQLETRIGEGRDGYRWDAEAWYGGDFNKLWVKTEGEGGFSQKPEAIEVQALWSRAITPWFDAQAGLRYDFRPDPERAHLVLGIQGLAPYFFELDAAAFLSDEGDVTARIEAEYDQLITQKLILQPRAELSLAAHEVEEIGLGSGFTSIEAGVRLRYEFTPEFAPYIGLEYERSLGQTADFAREEGEEVDLLHFLIGLRLWF